MDKSQLAELYTAKLKRCITVIKILVICMIAALAALVIFATAATGTGMKTSNYGGMLLGIIIISGAAFLCAFGVATAFIIASVYLKKLKNLGNVEDDT